MVKMTVNCRQHRPAASPNTCCRQRNTYWWQRTAAVPPAAAQTCYTHPSASHCCLRLPGAIDPRSMVINSPAVDDQSGSPDKAALSALLGTPFCGLRAIRNASYSNRPASIPCCCCCWCCCTGRLGNHSHQPGTPETTVPHTLPEPGSRCLMPVLPLLTLAAAAAEAEAEAAATRPPPC